MNRKIEHISFVRSDNLQYVQADCNELVKKGYELFCTDVLGERFIVTMVKYIEPVKESEVLVPTKKSRTPKTRVPTSSLSDVKKVELQVPKRP